MVYGALRAVVSLALRRFFRVEAAAEATAALARPGPVLLVANHPAALIDPGLVFALSPRRLTFLAKAPLFSLPVLGWLLKGLGALPVYRKKDGADPAQNEGTLTASVDALVAGRALMLFPEGISHTEPQLAALKTGAARIALEGARRGAAVQVVPVGLTYEAKTRFRSRVRLEVGPALAVRDFLEAPGEAPAQAARRLTDSIAAGLRAVTLNLDAWDDLPLLATAEAVFALGRQARPGDPERMRAFARGLQLVRAEQPERYQRLQGELASFRRRLDLVAVRPDELGARYRPATVAWFVGRNLLWLAALPLFALGMGLFTLPYLVPQAVVRLRREEPDMEATVMLLVTLLLAPAWWALLTGLAAAAGGWPLGLAAFVGVPPLALFTRSFLERRTAALRDARVFLRLVSHRGLQARLAAEGQALADELEQLAQELGPRVLPPAAPTRSER
jgi:1-acyl-sn-glycerol-3-phosphate acyltransferase